MSRAVTNNADALRFLVRAKPSSRIALLKTADKELIRCICECVLNTINGHVPLNQSQKNKLTKHKNVLRKLVQRGGGINKKKKLLLQNGGAILPLILAPLLTGVLGSLFR